MHTHTLHLNLLVVVSAGFLVSCATYLANRYYADRTYAPKDPAQVQALHREPGRHYKVIADFQSRGDTEESLRVKAARIGGLDAADLLADVGCGAEAEIVCNE